MNRIRVAAALTGLGALTSCPAVWAFGLPEPVRTQASAAQSSTAALTLLRNAAQASREEAWSATRRVLSFVSGTPVMTVAPVGRGPGLQSTADALDMRLFRLLEEHYQLVVVGASRCEQRMATLVEARHTTGGVAARFWVDSATGMVLRRDVHDEQGALLRRTDLVGLVMRPTSVQATSAPMPTPQGVHLDDMALRGLERDGWPVPRNLPGRLALYDARWLDDGVLQLAYSDGLSTLSLFVQQGELSPARSGVLRRVGDGEVWTAPGEPERMAWVSQGMTWTLVSDAPPALVDDVLVTLPHHRQRLAEDGVAPRVWRGLNRVGAWLNPFS